MLWGSFNLHNLGEVLPGRGLVLGLAVTGADWYGLEIGHYSEVCGRLQ